VSVNPFARATTQVVRLLIGLASVLGFAGWYWGLSSAQRAQFLSWISTPLTSTFGRLGVPVGYVLVAAVGILLAVLMFRPLVFVLTSLLGALAHQTPIDYAGGLGELGLTKMRQGHYRSSEAYFRIALAMKKAVAGPDHRETATTTANLAKVMQRQGRYRRAVRLYQRALKIKEQAVGPRDASLVPTMVSLAFTLHSLGRDEEAETTIRKALDVARVTEREQLIAGTMHQLSRILMLRGKHGEAHAEFKKTVAMRIKLNGASSPQTATTQYRWGQNFRLRGLYGEALHLQLPAARVLRSAGSPYEFSQCLGELSATLRRARRPRLALRIARYRVVRVESTFSPAHPQVQASRQALIETLRAVSTPEALREAERLARTSALIPTYRGRAVLGADE
jgi:hypothetical protein